jgi:hypothetical protein
MCCSPIMEGLGWANGGPSQGGHWGAAMVTSAMHSFCLMAVGLECIGLIGWKQQRAGFTEGLSEVFYSRSHDHEPVCVQSHEFFIDNNGEWRESLLGK